MRVLLKENNMLDFKMNLKEYQNLILEERAKFDKESEYLKIRNKWLK